MIVKKKSKETNKEKRERASISSKGGKLLLKSFVHHQSIMRLDIFQQHFKMPLHFMTILMFAIDILSYDCHGMFASADAAAAAGDGVSLRFNKRGECTQRQKRYSLRNIFLFSHRVHLLFFPIKISSYPTTSDNDNDDAFTTSRLRERESERRKKEKSL